MRDDVEIRWIVAGVVGGLAASALYPLLLEERGGRIVKPARKAEWGGYSGYFADPYGFLWEVAWKPHFPHV